MKSPLQEENENLVKEFLARVEIASVGELVKQEDWDNALSVILGDLFGELIDRVRDDEIEKATEIWAVYIEKMIGHVENRLKAKANEK